MRLSLLLSWSASGNICCFVSRVPHPTLALMVLFLVSLDYFHAVGATLRAGFAGCVCWDFVGKDAHSHYGTESFRSYRRQPTCSFDFVFVTGTDENRVSRFPSFCTELCGVSLAELRESAVSKYFSRSRIPHRRRLASRSHPQSCPAELRRSKRTSIIPG